LQDFSRLGFHHRQRRCERSASRARIGVNCRKEQNLAGNPRRRMTGQGDRRSSCARLHNRRVAGTSTAAESWQTCPARTPSGHPPGRLGSPQTSAGPSRRVVAPYRAFAVRLNHDGK
jgi:hypothetical protein